MLALSAALVFTAAFLFSVGLIVLMLVGYRAKIMAAVLFQPIPKDAPTCRMMEVRRVHRS